MQKKQTILVVASLLVVVLSVTLAYFTAQIIGKGKNVTINSADLKIVFTDTDGNIEGTGITPGWSSSKTFTVKNESNGTYKYNIIIKDLVNTFKTYKYLQYKITSTDVSLSNTEAIDEDTCKTKSLCNLGFPTYKVIFGLTQAQCQELVKKHSFSHAYEESDYSEDLTNRTWVTELIKPINNWVKFGKYQNDLIGYRGYKSTTDTSYHEYSTMDECTSASSYNTNCTEYKYANTGDDIYWRIIRTNSDGSVRLLYHGTSTTTTEAYIGASAFNTTYNNPMYVGYMYGTSGSLVNNRTNTNNSTIKGIIDTWYENNLKINYTKYLSTTAVYCNDRSNPAGGYNTDKKTEFYYGGYTRLGTNKTPTYDCTNVNDKFTVDTSTGNGKLTYPIALMTADEVSFAGGVYFTSAETWYYKNSAKGSSTGSTLWWLLSPSNWNNGSANVFLMHGSSGHGNLSSVYVFINAHGVRPAISLKSCVKTSGGDGSASDPYTIKETTSGC